MINFFAQYRHKISFYKITSQKGSFLNNEETETKVKDIFCDVVWDSARQIYQGNMDFNTNSVTVFARYDRDITEDMIFIFAGYRYEIEAIEDVDFRNHQMRIRAKRVKKV